MSYQEIRNKNGHTLSQIHTLPYGKQEIRIPKGHSKGTYDPKTNETRDLNGHLVARGNVLSTLI